MRCRNGNCAMNELLFVMHVTIISIGTLVALWFGQVALMTLVSIYCLLANLFVLKQITLCGYTATAADAYTIGATICLNMIQEYYGRVATRHAIIINMGVLALYVLLTQLHLWYMPSSFDTTHEAYAILLGNTPRIIISSFVVYGIAQQIDYYLYGFLMRHTPTSWILVRNYASVLVSQLFDTIAFSLLGLYGLVHNIGHIIVVSYSIKIIAIFMSSPFIHLARVIRKN
jgi:queuosine precursor transporter